jgi:preprotein translocase subunit SecD
MNGSDHRIGSKKAGLSGLFCCAVLALASLAASALAEPLAIEGQIFVATALDERTKAPIVTLKMQADSARRFAEFTTKNVGRKMELRIDVKPVLTTVIRERIVSGSLQISDPSWTVAKVRELAELMAASNGEIEFELASE